MKNRISVKLSPITTREEAEATMNDLAATMNNQRKLLTNRDAEILKITSSYEPAHAKLSASIEQLTDALRDWAQSHPEEFPKGRKSIAFLSGVLGFRTGNPKLALLNRKWNWDLVLRKLMELGQDDYIRTIEEVDKEKLIAAARSNPNQDGAKLSLELFGTKIVQDESFYAEPDLSVFEARQTTEAA